MTIGEKIYNYRKQAGLSQEELADKMNVTRQSVSLWETDQTVPSLDSLMMLADLFSVSLDELCGAATDKTAKDGSSQPDACLAYTETRYTPELIKHINAVTTRKFYIFSIVVLVFLLTVALCVALTGANDITLLLPLFLTFLFFV